MIYLAEVYFKIETEFDESSSYEMELRIVHAINEEEALFEAKKNALNEECSFTNEKGQMVHWKLAGITKLILLNPEENGIPVYATTVEYHQGNSLTRFIEMKSRDLALQIGKKELNFSL